MRYFQVLWVGIAIFTVFGAPLASAQVPVPTLKPEAPESPWITSSDEALLRGVFDAVGDRNYRVARSLAATIEAPTARSLAQWAYLRSRDDAVTAAEIDTFLSENYGWPQERTLQSKAEEMFDDDTPVAQIMSFFDQRDPITGEGHLQLARAFFQNGNQQAGVAQLRLAWIDYDWTNREERNIISRYGRYLTPADHFAKADRQLFEIKATATESLLPLLDATRRAEALTRIAFLRADRNAVGLYNNLPQSSAVDSGVLHAAARYHRRNDQEDQAITYASIAPLDREELRNPGRWFAERKLLARWALRNGRFSDAYILSAYSGLEEGANFAEAEFMAGWMALRFLGDPERAKAHFAFLSTGVTSPISRARGEYWLARAWAAAGDDAIAAQHYRVASEYPYTFYGQLAIGELGDNAPAVTFPIDEEPPAAELAVFEARPLVHAMRILAEINQSTHYDRFARSLDDQIQSIGEVHAYFDLVMGQGKTYLAVRGGKVARNNGAEVPSVVYPLYPVPSAAAEYVEEPLILGLTRQESEFNPRAFSSARARGLMQLLASTARITARQEGIPFRQSALLNEPSYNMTLGAAHLSHLLERFNGSYILVLVGYNAGPHRATQWIDRYGDPRTTAVDPIDWIEMIPFSETRNYVMRVLENTQVYRSRIYGEPIGLRLRDDLVRGGNALSSIGAAPSGARLLQASFAAQNTANGTDTLDARPEGFGVNILNTPSRLPLAVEQFNTVEFPPLHDGAVPEVETNSVN